MGGVTTGHGICGFEGIPCIPRQSIHVPAEGLRNKLICWALLGLQVQLKLKLVGVEAIYLVQVRIALRINLQARVW
jgi:hypothetical protein